MRKSHILVAIAALTGAGLLMTGAHAAPPPDEPGLKTPRPGAPSPQAPALPGVGTDGEAGGKEDSGKAGRKRAKPGEPLDRDAMLAELYTHLARAPDAEQAAPIAKTIETLWLRSGSDTIGVLMRRALKAMREKRLDLAQKLLDAVVDLKPDYAEGWSRRAYLYYRQNDYQHAAGDLRRALALEPNHYKALEGLARILRESGQKKSALKVYEQLLRIHPFMPGAKEAHEELTVEVEGQRI